MMGELTKKKQTTREEKVKQPMKKGEGEVSGKGTGQEYSLKEYIESKQ